MKTPRKVMEKISLPLMFVTFVMAVLLLATFGVVGGSVGFVDSAEASSYGHGPSTNLAGRSFQIHGTYVSWDEALGGPTPPGFDNCYTFIDDDAHTWIDPLFPGADNPVSGTWIQHTGGVLTRYTAFANADIGIGIRLIQNGIVTPPGRRGKLRLDAYSTIILNFGGFGEGDVVLGVVSSIGHSVDSCE